MEFLNKLVNFVGGDILIGTGVVLVILGLSIAFFWGTNPRDKNSTLYNAIGSIVVGIGTVLVSIVELL